ncbi:unnamed protein product, partial [Arabidopsis halleri]
QLTKQSRIIESRPLPILNLYRSIVLKNETLVGFLINTSKSLRGTK